LTQTAVTAQQQRRLQVGVILCLVAATGLGLAVAFSRYAYMGGTNGLTVATVRGVVMTCGVLVVCLATGRNLRLPRRVWLHCAGLGVLTSMMFYGNIGAVEYIPVGLTALLFFTYPPMVAVINVVVLRERLGPAKFAAVATAFVGLALMLGVSFAAVDLRGVALVMAAAVAAAWHAVWLVRRVADIDPVVVTFHMALVAATVLLVVSLSSGNVVWPSAAVGWAGMAGVVCLQASSVPLYFIGLARIGALRSAVITNLQPVVSIVAAFLLFGEILTPVQLIGGAMVLAGIWLMQWAGTRSDQ
jgi:DME family drug/metabolite transporter